MRLDDDKLEALRRWGQALRQADGEDFAAAGRAMLMLIDEIDRLRFELGRTREQLSRPRPALSAGTGANIELEEPSSTLHQRLQRVLRRDPEALSAPSSERPIEAKGTGIGSDGTTASPEGWIESLRRQT
jgi:hypothetical protein